MSQFFDEIKLEAKRKREEKEFLRINKDVCLELKKRGENERIYQLFGQAAYRKYASKRYQKEDYTKLKKEERYEDIYLKYGEERHDGIVFDAMYREIKQEKGIIPAMGLKMKEFGYKTLAILLASFISLTGQIVHSNDKEIKNNSIIYAEQISESNFKIEEYVKQFEGKNLTDLEIIMKVIDDMWAYTQGYKAPPKIDARGFLELDVTRENGYGVCRNFATYVAKVLKALGYKAGVLHAYMDKDSYQYYIESDVPTKKLDQNGETKEKIEENDNIVSENSSNINVDNSEEVDDMNRNLLEEKWRSNHLVTIVYIEEDDIYLVIDPTNPGIGILMNGEIDILNELEEGQVKLLSRPFEYILKDGKEGVKSLILYVLNWLKTTPKDLEKLEGKYSLESQNEALYRARRAFENKNDNHFEDRLKEGVDQNKINEVSNGFSTGNQSTNTRSANSEEIDK